MTDRQTVTSDRHARPAPAGRAAREGNAMTLAHMSAAPSPWVLRGARLQLRIAAPASVVPAVAGIAFPVVRTVVVALLSGALLAARGAVRVVRAPVSGGPASRAAMLSFGAVSSAGRRAPAKGVGVGAGQVAT